MLAVGHPRPVALRPRLGAEQKANAQARVALRPRRHGAARAGSRRPSAPRPPFPEGPRRTRPHQARRAQRLHHRARQAGAASPAQADRRRHRPRRPADHHDDRQDRPRTPRSRGAGRHADRPGTSTLQAGLVAIKPGDGAIVAMYGGADYTKRSSTPRPSATMQAGSTFKPFALSRRCEQGDQHARRRSTATARRLPRVRTRATKGLVRNFADEQFGDIDLRTATGHSVNTVFAQLNIEVGADKTRKAAIAAGCPANTPGLRGQPDQRPRHRVTRTSSTWPPPTRRSPPRAMRATPYLVKKVTCDDERRQLQGQEADQGRPSTRT